MVHVKDYFGIMYLYGLYTYQTLLQTKRFLKWFEILKWPPFFKQECEKIPNDVN